MNAFVNIHEAKTNLSKLVDRANKGEEIILAKGGKPWARIMPLEDKSKLSPRKGGQLKGLVGDIPDRVWFDPLPDEELDAWEGRNDNMV